MSVLVDPGARGRTGLVTVRRRWVAARRRSVACVAVVVLSAGVVACSGDGGGPAATASASGAGAPTSAPASASSTPSASPTPSALPSLSPELQASRDEALAEPKPERPEGMGEYSADGAKYSAFHFTNLYAYAFVTGDVTEMQEMSEDDCIFCNSVIISVTDLHASGGWVTPWEESTTIVATDVSTEDPTIFRVEMHMDSGPVTMYAGDGSIVSERTETIEQVLALKVRWNGRAWTIMEGAAQ